MLNYQQFYLFGQIQTSQTGGQLYSVTSPDGQYSLKKALYLEGSVQYTCLIHCRLYP